MFHDDELNLLQKIPFCEIPYDDSKELIEVGNEIKNNTEWYNYLPPAYKKTSGLLKDFENYKGLTLLTFDPLRNETDVIEGIDFKNNFLGYKSYYDVPQELRQIFQTKAAERFPKTINFIKKISSYPRLGKIVLTNGRHALSWHSHQRYRQTVKYYKESFIIHLPVITNPDMLHIVSRNIESGIIDFTDKQRYINDSNLVTKNFEKDKLYFFNSYLWHASVNFSNSLRISLLLNNDGDSNPPLENIIRKMLNKYDGILINESNK
jgi:hypothetical protein